MENVFDRTACFTREPIADGKFRVRRIPWDLIAYGSGPFMVSPMPVALNGLAEVTTDTTISDSFDLIAGDELHIDEIIDILWFESEAVFYSKYEGAFGYYDTNENQSAEFGYPR